MNYILSILSFLLILLKINFYLRYMILLLSILISCFSAQAKEPVLVAVVDMGIDYYKIKELKPYMYQNNRFDHGWDFGINGPSEGVDYNYKAEGQHHGTFIAFLISNPLKKQSKIKLLDVVYSDYYGNLFQLNQYLFPENNLQVYRRKKAYEKFSEHLSKTFAYAESTGARVINFSSSDRGFQSDAMGEYLKSAASRGTFLVVSAGNDSSFLTDFPQYPCNYDYENIICVGAVDKRNKKAEYSNYGKGVDLYAKGNFGPYEGTSFSAPVISRAVALIVYRHPQWSNKKVRGELFKYVFFKDKLPIFNHKDFEKKYN